VQAGAVVGRLGEDFDEVHEAGSAAENRDRLAAPSASRRISGSTSSMLTDPPLIAMSAASPWLKFQTEPPYHRPAKVALYPGQPVQGGTNLPPETSYFTTVGGKMAAPAFPYTFWRGGRSLARNSAVI
jgi:hypothetical protein